MGEMAQALKALGSIKDAWIINNPNGTWSFVGMVDGRLNFIHNDGTEPTIEELKKIASSQLRWFTMKTLNIKARVFATKEEAEIAAKAIGQAWKETIKEGDNH